MNRRSEEYETSSLPSTPSKQTLNNNIANSSNPSIPYYIDYTVLDTGKHITRSKKHVKWKFGISSPLPFHDKTGPQCRGLEHEIEFFWSISSGKRKVVVDKYQTIHNSVSNAGRFEHGFALGNHQCRIVAYATAPLLEATTSTTNISSGKTTVAYKPFRQFDLIVDGQSVFDMLGNAGRFEHGFALGNNQLTHQCRIVAYATAPLLEATQSTTNVSSGKTTVAYKPFRQFDLIVDGQSVFDMLRIYQLGECIDACIRRYGKLMRTVNQRTKDEDDKLLAARKLAIFAEIKAEDAVQVQQQQPQPLPRRSLAGFTAQSVPDLLGGFDTNNSQPFLNNHARSNSWDAEQNLMQAAAKQQQQQNSSYGWQTQQQQRWNQVNPSLQVITESPQNQQQQQQQQAFAFAQPPAAAPAARSPARAFAAQPSPSPQRSIHRNSAGDSPQVSGLQRQLSDLTMDTTPVKTPLKAVPVLQRPIPAPNVHNLQHQYQSSNAYNPQFQNSTQPQPQSQPQPQPSTANLQFHLKQRAISDLSSEHDIPAAVATPTQINFAFAQQPQPQPQPQQALPPQTTTQTANINLNNFSNLNNNPIQFSSDMSYMVPPPPTFEQMQADFQSSSVANPNTNTNTNTNSHQLPLPSPHLAPTPTANNKSYPSAAASVGPQNNNNTHRRQHSQQSLPTPAAMAHMFFSNPTDPQQQQQPPSLLSQTQPSLATSYQYQNNTQHNTHQQQYPQQINNTQQQQYPQQTYPQTNGTPQYQQQPQTTTTQMPFQASVPPTWEQMNTMSFATPPAW
eukprot:CAMPEP_0194394656 /NCGR_PEP_ID=MMETSP0174-20130528/123972_1 /TAXON_ID=216777 /ORGANISM="Proboscia alata, Strain PI-D3" /LENGTH=786 /DNA_ID=CAMNT_0039190473 /DNA_START=152 /DNA_END=2513 /DNA_ORIENTATION=+